MDELKPFNSKLVTDTYIGYSEHNSRGQPIVRRAATVPSPPRHRRAATLVWSRPIVHSNARLAVGI